jgi:hypothetical protein
MGRDRRSNSTCVKGDAGSSYVYQSILKLISGSNQINRQKHTGYLVGSTAVQNSQTFDWGLYKGFSTVTLGASCEPE